MKNGMILYTIMRAERGIIADPSYISVEGLPKPLVEFQSTLAGHFIPFHCGITERQAQNLSAGASDRMPGSLRVRVLEYGYSRNDTPSRDKGHYVALYDGDRLYKDGNFNTGFKRLFGMALDYGEAVRCAESLAEKNLERLARELERRRSGGKSRDYEVLEADSVEGIMVDTRVKSRRAQEDIRARARAAKNRLDGQSRRG